MGISKIGKFWLWKVIRIFLIELQFGFGSNSIAHIYSQSFAKLKNQSNANTKNKLVKNLVLLITHWQQSHTRHVDLPFLNNKNYCGDSRVPIFQGQSPYTLHLSQVDSRSSTNCNDLQYRLHTFLLVPTGKINMFGRCSLCDPLR